MIEDKAEEAVADDGLENLPREALQALIAQHEAAVENYERQVEEASEAEDYDRAGEVQEALEVFTSGQAARVARAKELLESPASSFNAFLQVNRQKTEEMKAAAQQKKDSIDN